MSNIFEAMVNEPNEPIDAEFFPQTVDPYDLTPVKARFAKYETKIHKMVLEAKNLQVVDEASEVVAVEMANQSKKLSKGLEAIKKELTEKHNQYVRSVGSLTKSYTEPLAAIPRTLGDKITRYHSAKELERRKQQEAERKAAAELQKKLNAEAKAAKVEPVQVAAPVRPGPPKVVRTAEGSAHTRKRWVGRVTDEAQVPREYLMVDQKAINQAVAGGVRNIPGVSITEEVSAVFRT